MVAKSKSAAAPKAVQHCSRDDVGCQIPRAPGSDHNQKLRTLSRAGHAVEELDLAANPGAESFAKHLSRASRIVALLGAGLSASSGLPTFRQSNSSWNGCLPRGLL